MHTDNLLTLLDAWVEHGWLRPLDRALVRFLREQAPDTPALVLLAAALTSHQLGRGHVCLDLPTALARPDETLSLPPDGEKEAHADRPSHVLKGITLQKLKQSFNACRVVGADEDNSPLVLNAERLYLRRYWRYTRQVGHHIMERLKQKLPVPEDLADRLDRMFANLRTDDEKAKNQIHWQSVAAVVAASSDFSVISGGPGTGKTTTVVQLLGLLQEISLEQGEKLRIRVAAPTGKAAARLTESIGHDIDQLPGTIRECIPSEVTTLHRLLGSRPDTRHFLHNAQNPMHVDLLVVDEASMVDLEMMAALLEALPTHARLILLGDKDQLASVEAGSVLGDLCRHAGPSQYRPETSKWIEHHTGYRLCPGKGKGFELDQHIVVLQKSHRFGETSGIGALARAVNAGDPKKVASVWDSDFSEITQIPLQGPEDKRFTHLVLDGTVHPLSAPEASNGTAGYRTYLERLETGPQPGCPEEDWLRAILKDFSRFQLLSPLRRGDWGVVQLNERTALALFNAGLISATSGWYPGRPVMITRNDYSLSLMNGDTGIVLPVSDPTDSRNKSLKAVFPMPDSTLKKVPPSRLTNVETVYAMTVHKSQGSEFDHTALVFPDRMSPVLTRELIYTAITRSRTRFTLAGPRLDTMALAVKQRVHRASGLGDLLSPGSRRS